MHYQSFIKDYQIVVKPARRSIIDGNAIEIAAHRIKFKDCLYTPKNSEHMTKQEEEKYLDMRIEKQRRIRMWKVTDAELKLAKEKAKEMAHLNAKYKVLQDDVDKTKPMRVRDKRFIQGTSSTVNSNKDDKPEEIESPPEEAKEPIQPIQEGEVFETIKEPEAAENEELDEVIPEQAPIDPSDEVIPEQALEEAEEIEFEDEEGEPK